MAFPTFPDRPEAGHADIPTPPLIDTAPPLAPVVPEQSPWWSAPAGKPFGIPDFSHEMRALMAWLAGLLLAPKPVPVRVKARRR
ncbi:MAG: hypothetical protein AB7V13_10225 [Pseudorhodoplanes sp.]|uniref:hypothetical protein n=1 Tax=Pseudorhodoplanes sp. TaxID=1934341 RepID=UPI003D106BB8